MNLMAAYRRPPTAQEAVLAEIRRSIVSGELTPGQPIRQEVVAERLGVSRVPVREALKILQGEGQVEYQHRRDTAATQIEAASALDFIKGKLAVR